MRALLIGIAVLSMGPLYALTSLGTAYAEPVSNTITVEPLALILTRTIALEYERTLSDTVSLFVAPSFTTGSVTSGDNNADFLSLGASAGVRFYLTEPAPAGLFLNPLVQVAWASGSRDDVSGTGVGWSAGGLVGYAWVLSNTFDLSVGLGAAYYRLDLDVDGETFDDAGIQPLGRLAVGVAF
ncbi:MAG: hypothetical protein ACI9MR_000803 [Myxococcota bacterium]|jgi:hypothetical protein